MTKRRPKRLRDTDKYSKLEQKARARYVYFVSKDPDTAGYWWELFGPDDQPICSSVVFRDKPACLKSLRAMQRHAATAPVRDDAR